MSPFFKLPACFLFFLVCFLAEVAPLQAGLKIYYIRHGESGGNVKKKWENVPKDQWPAYVGNSDSFSPEGEKQVAAVPEKLKQFRFDFIAASPLWRTRNTILGYLQQENRKAEIWPELAEFRTLDFTLPLQAPSPDLFTGGTAVELPEKEKDYFLFREGNPPNVKVSRDNVQASSDVRVMLDRVVEMIKTRFGGKDQSILLVGHGTAGGALLKKLLGEGAVLPEKGIRNTGVWMVEEQPDGKFKLMIYNDQPYAEPVPQGAAQ